MKGFYLGQTPPEQTVKKFDPVIGFFDVRGYPVFSGDGARVIFYGESDGRKSLYEMKRNGKIWDSPVKILSSGSYREGHFMFSPDGRQIHFTSKRPVSGSEQSSDNWNLWMMDQTDTGWSEPAPFEMAINSGWNELYGTVSASGTLYFLRTPSDDWEKADIYRAGLSDGRYPEAVNLGLPVSSDVEDVDPCIAPDESYVIYCSHLPGGMGDHDIYIAYRHSDGTWSEPVTLGPEINTSSNEVCPWVTLDGRYFFFSSNHSGEYEAYWVSAGFIEELKPE